MDIITVPLFFKEKVLIGKENINELKKEGNIIIVSSIQYLKQLGEIKKELEKEGIKCKIGGQILGCNHKCIEKAEKGYSTILYIGDGNFHPSQFSKVFLYNPISKQLIKKDYGNKDRIRAARYSKFLISSKIGIIVSLKKYQNKLSDAVKLKKNLEKIHKDKQFFIFLFDNVDDLENFKIDFWVNYACPRIEDDINTLNAKDLIEFAKIKK